MTNNPTNQSQGFTLTELMIVIAIIGILSMIALPAYQDYTRKTHLSEGLQMAATFKTTLVEYFSVHGRLADVDDVRPYSNANQFYGLLNPKEYQGNAVDSISIGNTSMSLYNDYKHRILIRYNEKVMKPKGAKYPDIYIFMQNKNGSISWVCGPAWFNMIKPTSLPPTCKTIYAGNGFPSWNP